ncbi:hypothetical protein OIDMADRAFT_22002 [Oidiodendron maius Zn]|uniref:Uncharacterized protein n=1 Tax=Oidiodendron maius (strain Zn) TaxID=913774 RepID=A0A0C3HY23_OIDMZ|nr:hypothetical protein OIDMADRAFT_22002 [Oidiodendron maius Zn]
MYLHFGHIRVARAIVDSSEYGSSREHLEMAYREETVVLALISAVIDIQPKLDFGRAVIIFESVQAVFFRQELPALQGGPWDGPWAHESLADNMALPELVIALELWSITLHFLLIQEGFYGGDPSLSRRASGLHRYLKRKGPRWLEADLLHLLASNPSMFGLDMEIVSIQDEFLNRLTDEEWSIKGQILIANARLTIYRDRGQAEQMLQAAETIYKNAGCFPGSLWVSSNRLSLTDSPTESAVKSYILLSEKYVHAGMVFNSFDALAAGYMICGIELWPYMESIEEVWMTQASAHQNQLPKDLGFSPYIALPTT